MSDEQDYIILTQRDLPLIWPRHFTIEMLARLVIKLHASPQHKMDLLHGFFSYGDSTNTKGDFQI